MKHYNIPRVAIRARRVCPRLIFLLSTILFGAFLGNAPSAEAGLRCAAREHIKPSIIHYKDTIRNAIQNTDLLKQSLDMRFNRIPTEDTIFDYATNLFYSKHFSPKDVVCIADNEETKETLENSPIWHTYVGTTVLLSPFSVQPPATRYGPLHSTVFDLMADTLAFFTIHDFCTRPDLGCPERVERDRNEYAQQLLSELSSSVMAATSLAVNVTYDPSSSNLSSNATAFDSFYESIFTLETINGPFYRSPISSESEPNLPQYRVHDPVNGQQLPVTSLVMFVAKQLSDAATDFLFKEHEANWLLYDEFMGDYV